MIVVAEGHLRNVVSKSILIDKKNGGNVGSLTFSPFLFYKLT
jgi:hypothetical protein